MKHSFSIKVISVILIIIILSILYYYKNNYEFFNLTSGLVIVSAHYNEDLEWLKKSVWPVLICDKPGAASSSFAPDPSCTLDVNRGREASSYLKYIINNYDNLPNYIAFIHGHEDSYHQNGGKPLLEMIKTANVKKYEYIPLNNRWRLITRSTMIKEHENFIKDFNLDIPQVFVTNAHAQFIVSKNRILRNPKEYYTKIYNYMMEKTQKEYYLNEQMNAIQKELGNFDDYFLKCEGEYKWENCRPGIFIHEHNFRASAKYERYVFRR